MSDRRVSPTIFNYILMRLTGYFCAYVTMYLASLQLKISFRYPHNQSSPKTVEYGNGQAVPLRSQKWLWRGLLTNTGP
jgi:hypothetical protein